MSVITPAQFAPVAPIQILEELVAKEEFGKYHLFLAHHIVDQQERFRNLMRGAMATRILRYNAPLIIMDNSIVELGGSVDDGMIKEAVQIVSRDYDAQFKPHVIPVLPDVMGKGEETIYLVRDAYKRWTVRDERGFNWMPGAGYMLVTQGASWQDFCNLVNYFFVHHLEQFPAINWVGIPRVLLHNGSVKSRAQAVQYVQMVAPHVNIHLLGFSDNITDDVTSVRLPGVRGIDSAVPVRYDSSLTPSTTPEEIGPRPTEWMETGALSVQNLHNIQNCRKWVSGF